MRYLPHTPQDIDRMLKTVGIGSIDELFETIPKNLQRTTPLEIPPAKSEEEVEREFARLTGLNRAGEFLSFLGGGQYPHRAPRVVDHLLRRSEFYTAYTPYQPEVSQGTLQAIFEYQTLMCLLLEMDVTNASMYDGATACAEAALMSLRVLRKKNKVLIARSVHPEFRQVTKTYMVDQPECLVEVGYGPDGRLDRDDLKAKLDGDCACLIVGHPNYFGTLEDLPALAEIVHEAGALMVSTFTEPLAFGLIPGPGRAGADIVCGEGQSFLGDPNFGGPSLGIFSATEKNVRQMPGRLCGEATDADGRKGYVLTLSTREQHIRRDKATSNICTNQGLMALAATIFLSTLGKQGVHRLARTNLSKAAYLKKKLAALDGFSLAFDAPTFNEFVIRCDKATPAEVLERLLKKNVVAGLALENDYTELDRHLLVCATEMHAKEDLDRLADELAAL